jgi:hypothetical protein
MPIVSVVYAATVSQ